MSTSSGSGSWGLGALVVTGVALVVLGATGGGSSASSLEDASRLAAPLPAAAATPVNPQPHRQDLGASSIAIPTLAVTAGIGQATLDNGELTPPLDPAVVGAWSGSAPLEAPGGEITLTGHVNYGTLGPFAFAHLAALVPGDLIYTTDAHDNQTAWRITTVTARPKSLGVDPAAFAGNTGPRSLVLITCGGPFNTTQHSYDANIYVYATPVPLP